LLLNDLGILGYRHIDKLWEYYVGRGRVSGMLPADWIL
jgi:hypothetical protein